MENCYDCNHCEVCRWIDKFKNKGVCDFYENGIPLDKIRAEIESQRKKVSNKNSENDELQAYYHGLNDGLKDARDILDKYRAESEE